MIELVKKFKSASQTEDFFQLGEEIFETVKDPYYLAECAVLAGRREPGGAFYRARFWAKTFEAISKNEDEVNLRMVCKKLGINQSQIRKYIIEGSVIDAIAEKGIDVKKLRYVSPKVFEHALKQKSEAPNYLIEALSLMEKTPDATFVQINRNWCNSNGNLSSKFDIIKPSDWWAFGQPKWLQEENFPGSIPGEVYANALYYFAPHKGIAVDPMAGSGMLKRVYDDKELWQKDIKFDLQLYLFDLYPQREFIKGWDARKELTIKADWIFLDPPYFKQSSHLYSGFLANTESYIDYLTYLEAILIAMYNSLTTRGKLCIFLPKWSGLSSNDPNYDIPHDVKQIALKKRFKWIDTAHVLRGRQQEAGSAMRNIAAKQNKRMISDTCILNVFEK